MPIGIALALVGVVLLAGCAATSEQGDTARPGLGPAERVASLLSGRYAGRALGASEDGLVRLEVRVEGVEADGVRVRMLQIGPEGEERAFGLVLEPTRVTTRLDGRFAPLDARGAALGSCPLAVTLRPDGVVATTDGASCRFGSGAGARALVKEIAHDGERLVIADRIVDVASGEPIGEDRVLEFSRVRAFEVWAGVADGGDGNWRIARSLEVLSDGVEHRPVDAAGMTMGFSFELAPHRMRNDQPPVLRLRVFGEDGRLLAQSWGDAGAARLGIALPKLQIGLRALER